jgi:hypothetical protein
MSRPRPFTQTDVENVLRARPKRTYRPSLASRIKAVIRAGCEPEVKPDGTVIGRERATASAESEGGAANPWDTLP